MLLRCVAVLCVFCFAFISALSFTYALTHAATATATASAKVVSPLQTRLLLPLQFGRVHPGEDGGVISINPQSNRRHFEGTAHPLFGPRGHSAAFYVKGERLRAYTITLPDEVYITKRFGHSLPMQVTNFRAYSRNKRAVGSVGILNRAGRDLFFVGGDLILTSSASPGLYTANIDVVVTYQ